MGHDESNEGDDKIVEDGNKGEIAEEEAEGGEKDESIKTDVEDAVAENQAHKEEEANMAEGAKEEEMSTTAQETPARTQEVSNPPEEDIIDPWHPKDEPGLQQTASAFTHADPISHSTNPEPLPTAPEHALPNTATSTTTGAGGTVPSTTSTADPLATRLPLSLTSAYIHHCDGPCGTNYWRYAALFICTVCLGKKFCGDCLELVKAGTLTCRDCHPDHDWFQAWPIPATTGEDGSVKRPWDVAAEEVGGDADGDGDGAAKPFLIRRDWLEELRGSWLAV